MTRAVAVIRQGYVGFATEVQQFFAWWIQEIREVGVTCARRWLPGRSLQFVIDLREDPGAVRRSGGSDADADAKAVVLNAQGELPPAHNLWPQEIPRGARAEIILPSASVLTGNLLLPAASERELQAMMALQFERELPLPMDQLYVDWRVAGRTEHGMQHILFATARRMVVERLRDGVRAWGWRVAAVRGPAEAMQMNLLPAATHRFAARLEKRDKLLVWTAVFLVVLYGLVVAGQWIHERHSLAPLLERGQAQVTALAQERAKLTSQSEPLIAIREQIQRPSAAEALVTLSAAMPAGSWLYQAQFVSEPDGGVVVVLEGYAPSSTSVIDALQASAQFDRVVLVEAASAASGQDGERFQIKAQLRAVTAP